MNVQGCLREIRDVDTFWGVDRQAGTLAINVGHERGLVGNAEFSVALKFSFDLGLGNAFELLIN